MKPILTAAAVALFFSSCVTFKQYDEEANKGRDTSTEALVVTTDGKRITGPKAKAKIKYGLWMEYVTINGVKYNQKEIEAYQAGTGYWERMYKKPDEFTFVRRLRKGKLSLYHYDVYSYSKNRAERGYTDHYAFRKGDGPIQELSADGVAELLKDRPQAQEKFRSYFKSGRTLDKTPYSLKKMTEVVDLYNG